MASETEPDDKDGGVSIRGRSVTIHGDVVGRDKHVLRPADGQPPIRGGETGRTEAPPPEATTRSTLRRILDTYFSESELRDLCFDLNVDYESLPGESKADKARELVLYCERRARTPELVTLCFRLRPDAAEWQS